MREPVVLLHGFGAAAIGWLPVAAALSKTYDVLAPDLPGHGGAEEISGIPSLSEMARHIEGVLEELGIASFHLVGHSLGGAVALTLVERRRLRSSPEL